MIGRIAAHLPANATVYEVDLATKYQGARGAEAVLVA
jgi:hypothetical protein